MEKKLTFEIKIRYKTFRKNEPILAWLDTAIRRVAKIKGYQFVGSGFDFKSFERDLQFKTK